MANQSNVPPALNNNYVYYTPLESLISLHLIDINRLFQLDQITPEVLLSQSARREQLSLGKFAGKLSSADTLRAQLFKQLVKDPTTMIDFRLVYREMGEGNIFKILTDEIFEFAKSYVEFGGRNTSNPIRTVEDILPLRIITLISPFEGLADYDIGFGGNKFGMALSFKDRGPENLTARINTSLSIDVIDKLRHSIRKSTGLTDYDYDKYAVLDFLRSHANLSKILYFLFSYPFPPVNIV